MLCKEIPALLHSQGELWEREKHAEPIRVSIADKTHMTKLFPVWFLAHGAPFHLLGKNPVRQFWQQLANKLPRQPRAILCLSAHWLTPSPCLSGMVDKPKIQYDFSGFPDALYQIKWQLKGNANSAQWLTEKLQDCLGELELEPERAFDHGVWVPLINAWQEPDFPVYQLSLCPQQGAKWHLDLGKKLAPLREEDVLIIGSGGIVHNFAGINWQAMPGQVEPWAAEFMLAVESALAQQDYSALCSPWSLPYGRKCVPTIEHYLPLLVMLGSCYHEPVTALYQGWELGSLSLHSYTTSDKSHETQYPKPEPVNPELQRLIS